LPVVCCRIVLVARRCLPSMRSPPRCRPCGSPINSRNMGGICQLKWTLKRFPTAMRC